MLAYYHRKMVGDPMTKTKPKVNALNLAPQENIDIENSCHLHVKLPCLFWVIYEYNVDPYSFCSRISNLAYFGIWES